MTRFFSGCKYYRKEIYSEMDLDINYHLVPKFRVYYHPGPEIFEKLGVRLSSFQFQNFRFFLYTLSGPSKTMFFEGFATRRDFLRSFGRRSRPKKIFSYGFGRLRRPNNFLLPPPRSQDVAFITLWSRKNVRKNYPLVLSRSITE